jgi:hypothetical protein
MTIIQDKTGVTIRLHGKPNINKIQAYLDLMRHEEIVSKSKATDKAVEKLADELNINWWKKNKSRFIK